MAILVLNCGSSSLKFRVFDDECRREWVAGSVEGIGEPQGRASIRRYGDKNEVSKDSLASAIHDHREALDLAIQDLGEHDIVAVGHRVVHGGEQFQATTRVDDAMLETLAALDYLAPLHNPANRQGIRMATEAFPGICQIAVFDTAFHASIPSHAKQYAVSQRLRDDYGVRRYGFHGISHQYVTAEAARILNRPVADLNAITLHLGNGASAAAVRGGQSVDTSMGMTPLEGLVMGTRSGDIDPGALLHLLRQNLDLDTLDRELNKNSGLMGLAGNNDMRAVVALAEQGDQAAALALNVYRYRVKKTIGAYCAVLGRVDALIFTAGIGENDPATREAAVDGMEGFGLAIDADRNRAPSKDARVVHAGESRTAILVIPTREELQIAREVRSYLLAGMAEPES